MNANDGAITLLLKRWSSGSNEAGEQVFELIYADLKRVAAKRMQVEDGDMSLQITELVHETFLRLVNQDRAIWHDRVHFLAVSAQIMRRILVDHHRSKRRIKRSDPGQQNVSTNSERNEIDVLALHEALDRLALIDPSAAKLVVLRYFGGLSVNEAASVMSLGRTTLTRRWMFARIWLKRELTDALQMRAANLS